jgi:putative mRNA 3-end processing factor
MSVAAADLVVHRPAGLYCPPGDFCIDPSAPVEAEAVAVEAAAPLPAEQDAP